METKQLTAKILSIQIAKALVLFASAVYVLQGTAWYFQGRVLFADSLVPYESFLCVFVSGLLFSWFTYELIKLLGELKK